MPEVAIINIHKTKKPMASFGMICIKLHFIIYVYNSCIVVSLSLSNSLNSVEPKCHFHDIVIKSAF